jgi:glycosyltransferase involved in cell wall biosynthesis
MKILLFANTDWYLFNFRQSLAWALKEAGHEVILVSPPGSYGTKLVNLGFRWIPAPMERLSLNPLKELALVNWLRQLVNSEQIDVVHGFTIKCAVYGSLAARMAQQRNGRPVRVNSVAGMGYVFSSNDLKARVLRPMVRLALKLALGGQGSRLILQNPDDVALFEKASLVDPTQIRLIPGSGVNCERFAPSAQGLRELSPGEHMRVLLPARLLWDKGLAEFVEAARLVRAKGLPVDFLLAGDPDPGNPAAVPEDTVRGWVREGLLQWLGHVDDMPALFASMDVVALPSYREGLPKGLIEAGACGLALITTDVPGCREVVTHEEDGLLVRVKDGKALASAIERLHDQPELRKRLGSCARHTALLRYDERLIVSQTLEVYKSLLPLWA